MSNKNPFLLLVLLCFLPFSIIIGQPANTIFSFTLPSTAITSAGVYNSDSTLVRTLWSSVRYINGTHTERWDGLLEDRTPAPTNSSYFVKVLSHNVHYSWDGAKIGNTSVDATLLTRFKSYKSPFCLAIAGDSLYYGTEYNEQQCAQKMVNLNEIGKQYNIRDVYGENQATSTVCTDGNYVYWGGYLPSLSAPGAQAFVFATRLSNNSLVNFEYGVSRRLYSAIAASGEINNITSNPITGMAVQRTGSYLFVARAETNELRVVNKTTGEFVRNITLNGVTYLAVDGQDKLWASHGTTVEKYNVNSNGTITSTGITLSGIVLPGAIAVSPDNSTVAVADAATTQQVVKGFSNSAGGAAVWTLGVTGGYTTDATVTNYKFLFEKCALAYQQDGSLWVTDQGNNRIQHYSPARVFLNNIAYLSNYYEVHVDRNNKNRLFSSLGNGFMEFALDYTKTLDSGQNGSWKLAKNWLYPGNYYLRSGVTRTTTFAGHTFTLIRSNDTNNDDMFELVEGGQLRKTKITFSNGTALTVTNEKIDNPNGYGTGTASQYRLYAFIGLDSDNDPSWASTPYRTITLPIPVATDAIGPVGENLVGNKIYFYQGNRIENGNADEYHLAGLNVDNNKWLFKTSRGTVRSYSGDFPAKGEFDNGNGVDQAGAYMTINGSNLVWAYKGEFWGGQKGFGQTNKFNHFHTSGLFIGQWGELKRQGEKEQVPGSEGNMFSGSWVQDTPDRAYLFSGGEGVQGGVHRWGITGLSTIQTQTCSFNNSLNYAPPPPNLMAGLIHGQELTNGNGWAISNPSTPMVLFNTSWNVVVGKRTPSRYSSQDISIYYFQAGNNPSKIRTVTRSLGSNTGLNTWKLNGRICFENSHPSDNPGDGGCYVEILDNTGKVIATFHEKQFALFSPVSYMRGNNADLQTYSNPGERVSDVNRSQPFQISNNNNTLTFQYANYAAMSTTLAETGADVTNPTTLRLRFTPGGAQKAISVAELQFTKDTTNDYRTKQTGSWNDLNTWESSANGTNWNDAIEIPNSSAGTITIRTGDTVSVTGAAAVDQLTIQANASLQVAPKASLWINNAAGDDITIAATGNLTIQSDSSGTGWIGNSTGTINGRVVVENYIASSAKKAYHLLAPSVNTAGGPEPFIRDNWQEGQNNASVLANSNTVPRYGTHITGSLLGTNGFDATALATPSLLLFNQLGGTPGFAGIANTNATSLEAKKGYLLFVRGDRSIDLATGLRSSNTTLRATGTVLIGTQTFTGQEGSGRLSLVGNPYPSSINWNTVSADGSTTNGANFENYCTYWDPNIGENGGYVNISINGTKSNADNRATMIPAGQAFFIKAKSGVSAPTFTIKESHKSSPDDMTAFRSEAQAQFATSLYYTTLTGRRVQADAANAVFDSTLLAGVDGNDAEEIANEKENIALGRGGKMLGIEARPFIDTRDTLFLRTQRLNVQLYEWQFQPVAIEKPNLKAYLEDKFLNTRTEINCADSSITTIPFLVTVVPGSNAVDRFRIVFTTNTSLPVTLLTLKAYQKNAGIEVAWSTGNEEQTQRYEVEKSSDARLFTSIGSALPKAYSSSSNDYLLFDPNPREGNNYYRIKIFHKNGTITYSGIVNVKTGGKKADFEVYPNPVSGKTITIQFNNVSRGVYSASLINAVRQKVFTRSFSHSGGSASQTVVLGDELPLGTYFLQITGNGTTYNKKIVK